MRDRFGFVLGLLAAMGCSIVGCLEPARSTAPSRWSLSPAPVTYVYPEDPPVANAESLRNLLAGYRRQRRVVLIDVWSVSSDASRGRFGALVDLHRKHRVSGLQCVAVSFDNPGLWTSEIAPFLRSVRCSYPCVIVPPSARGEVVSRLAYEWNGTIPAALVFDRDGQLAAELIGDTSVDKIERVVGAVLAGRHQAIAPSSRPAGARISARARMLDLLANRTVGQSSSQWASPGDVEKMAEVIAKRCDAAIDWPNARVAVLPFSWVGGPGRAESGKALADAVARILSARHPKAVVDRKEADAVLARYNLTPLGVEYDPTVLAGKTHWTHIITGTLRSR